MRKFYKLSRTGKDKKPRNILVKTIFQGTIVDRYKTEKFAVLIHEQKAKYFQLKVLSITYFKPRVFLSFKSALLYINICYMVMFVYLVFTIML